MRDWFRDFTTKFSKRPGEKTGFRTFCFAVIAKIIKKNVQMCEGWEIIFVRQKKNTFGQQEVCLRLKTVCSIALASLQFRLDFFKVS